MTDEGRPGPKRYRIRAYDGEYEILADRNHLLVLDLDTARGFRIAEAELEGLRRTVAQLAGATGSSERNIRLAVHDWPDGDYVMDWVATT